MKFYFVSPDRQAVLSALDDKYQQCHEEYLLTQSDGYVELERAAVANEPPVATLTL